MQVVRVLHATAAVTEDIRVNSAFCDQGLCSISYNAIGERRQGVPGRIEFALRACLLSPTCENRRPLGEAGEVMRQRASTSQGYLGSKPTRKTGTYHCYATPYSWMQDVRNAHQREEDRMLRPGSQFCCSTQ